MNPKILIIDDSAEYRALLAHHVTTRWPKASVRQYDPLTAGRLPENFTGAGNDVVLLGHPAGDGDALLWLRQFVAQSRFPPVIFIGSGEERQIVEAIKAGAADYISKRRLNHTRLLELIDSVVGEPVGARSAGDDVLPSIRGYRFERRIAQSDAAVVYLARAESDGRELVLKILRQVPDAGGEAAFDRFLQEYELIARISHPNVVRIADLGVADDHAYIAMEFCSRGSLKRRIGAGLTREQAIGYMRQIAGALGALHEVGIFHRDLKPTNVMFREDGTLVLIDFGLAKQAQLKSEITGTGEIFGTPYYMSPEQGHAADVDHRGDIYSLGVIFFEMLTGRKPYEGDSAMSVIIQHNQAAIPSLPDDCADLQPMLEKMMAKAPEDRFQSVGEVLDWETASAGVSA